MGSEQQEDTCKWPLEVGKDGDTEIKDLTLWGVKSQVKFIMNVLTAWEDKFKIASAN